MKRSLTFRTLSQALLLSLVASTGVAGCTAADDTVDDVDGEESSDGSEAAEEVATTSDALCGLSVGNYVGYWDGASVYCNRWQSFPCAGKRFRKVWRRLGTTYVSTTDYQEGRVNGGSWSVKFTPTSVWKRTPSCY